MLWASRRARVLNAGAEPGSGLILTQQPLDEQERIEEDSVRSEVDFVTPVCTGPSGQRARIANELPITLEADADDPPGPDA